MRKHRIDSSHIRVLSWCGIALLSVVWVVGQSCQPVAQPGEEEPIVQDAGPVSDRTAADTTPEVQATETREQPEAALEPRPETLHIEETTPEAAIEETTTGLPPLRDGMKVQVRSIIDGDTVYVHPAGKSRWPYYKIRMWGYNSPECKKGTNKYGYGCIKDDESYGLPAYETLIGLINARGMVLTISCPQGGKTGLECKIDPYERGLAYLIKPDGTNVAIKMLSEGAGVVYTIFYPPLLKELCQAEADAIRNKKGMWKDGRDVASKGMNSNTKSWYYHRTASKTHDAICSKALGQDFKTLAGE